MLDPEDLLLMDLVNQSVSLPLCPFSQPPQFPAVDVPYKMQRSPRGRERSSQLFFVPKCVHMCAYTV